MTFEFGPTARGPWKYVLAENIGFFLNGRKRSDWNKVLKAIFYLAERRSKEDKPTSVPYSKIVKAVRGEGFEITETPDRAWGHYAAEYIGPFNKLLEQEDRGEVIQNEQGVGYRITWEVQCVDELRRPRGVLRPLRVSPDLIPRTAAVEKLKQALLREPGSGQCTYLTAAAGMGGIGKTALASLAMNDPEVQHRFPDGIIAVTMGRNPSKLRIEEELRAIPLVMEESTAEWTENYAPEKIASLFEGKAVLLVVDDVWDAADITWLPRTDLGNSAMLFTTRHRNFDSAVTSTAMVEADFLTPEEAREMLASRAGLKNMKELPPEADRVLLHCGHRSDSSRVPAFAVCIAGTMAKNLQYNWQDVLDHFANSRIDELKAPNQYSEHESVYDWIHASVAFMEPSDRARYLRCCVFQDDEVVPENTFLTRWKRYLKAGEKPESQVRRWLATLHNACLLNWNGEDREITFHDLHLDYIRWHASPAVVKTPAARP
jgi:NB-ARC domain